MEKCVAFQRRYDVVQPEDRGVTEGKGADSYKPRLRAVCPIRFLHSNPASQGKSFSSLFIDEEGTKG